MSETPETSSKMEDKSDPAPMTRRAFVGTAVAGVLSAAVGEDAVAQIVRERAGKHDFPMQAVGALPANVTRPWIGPDFWANRFQDWRLNQGRIECLNTLQRRGRAPSPW